MFFFTLHYFLDKLKYIDNSDNDNNDNYNNNGLISIKIVNSEETKTT